jgi:Domain of unknown function (DUF4279)
VAPLDENPNCEKTFASFRIGGDALVPDEITRTLNLEPDFACAKGEPFGAGRGRRPTGVWSITSEERVESTSIERHLVYLLDRIEPMAQAIADVVEPKSLATDFFCYWRSATGHGGPEVSAATLGRISRLNALLGFDMYGPFGSSD